MRLIYSYLNNRYLKVIVNESKSSKRKIRANVPQGSVIGSKLFNIYILMIYLPFLKLKLHSTDDTVIICIDAHVCNLEYLQYFLLRVC